MLTEINVQNCKKKEYSSYIAKIEKALHGKMICMGLSNIAGLTADSNHIYFLLIFMYTIGLECPPDRFGVSCLEVCDCEGKCDSVTGMCTCPAGKTGKNCSIGK
jgi:hypothetical protein